MDPRRPLTIALFLNAAMFVIELVAGLLGHSAGLLADSLDMLTDASAYAIALAAIGRSERFKARAAGTSGVLLLLLGIGVEIEVGRRFLTGSEPVGPVMFTIAGLALLVNAYVLRLLARHRRGEVHLRAAWIFTRADVVANLAVIVSAGLVMLTGSAWPDLIIGAGIGLYVMKEALEILGEARRA
jgi:cation diffusion facilitator family transporter